MKYGRKPRAYHDDVPHLSMLRRRLKLIGPTAPAPPCDYSTGMPTSLGAMLNDQLGDCTIAALYHRRQVVSFNVTGTMDTQSDATVEKAYELIDGYNPADPETDQGGIEQDVLTYCTQKGMPLDDGTVDQLLTFVEIDPQNALDIDWAIYDCLGLYIGLNVPAFLEQLEAPGSVWNVGGANDDTSIVGGHCVYVVGATARIRKVISWGSEYTITPAFWMQYVDEAYALVGNDLISAKTGKTLLGMTIPQLQTALTF